MTFKLTSELMSGFEEIDGQHRMLFQRLDGVLEAVKSDDLAATKQTFQGLGDYLIAHFAAEESFMAAASYPERSRHKAAHDLFMQDFAQLARELEATGLSVPVLQWITARVPEWIKFHIQVNDLPLGRFLASRRFRPDVESRRVDKQRTS
jgi:hemerythrin